MRSRSLTALLFLAGFFLAALVACNLLVNKFFMFRWPDFFPFVGGGLAVLSVGILPYPLTFLVTDLLSEVYGKRRANSIVLVGFVVSLFVVLFVAVGNAVPAFRLPGFAGPFVEAPSAERPLDWQAPLRLTLGPADADGGAPAGAPLELVPEDDRPIADAGTLCELLNRAIDRAYAGAGRAGPAPHFGWEPEWTADLDRPTGRGRLTLTGVAGGQATSAVDGDLELAPLMPRGELVPILGSPVSDGVFDRVFGNTLRAILASMLAYLVAQWFDIQLFHFWKTLTKGRHLWLRNNGSTVCSQLVDTTLVYFVLFIGVWPVERIWAGIFAGWYFKALIALCDTPLFYLGVWAFRRLDLAPEEAREEALLD